MYALLRGSIVIIVIIFLRILKKHKKGMVNFRIRKIHLPMIILLTIIIFFPVENIFVNFNTPQDVINYITSKDTICTTIEGENSCMVITEGKDSKSGEIYIICKNDGKYKIPYIWNCFPRPFAINGEFGSFDLYHVWGTEDYYFFGYCTSYNESLEISDSRSSVFNIKLNEEIVYANNLKSYTVSFYVKNLPEEYYVVIDNNKYWYKTQK